MNIYLFIWKWNENWKNINKNGEILYIVYCLFKLVGIRVIVWNI